MRLTELYPDERPREKMEMQGPAALSNAELIAILLRTGTKENNVIDVSRELLRVSQGSLVGTSALSIEQMMKVSGVGKSKAVTVAAAFELGRRFAAESGKSQREAITDSSMVYNIMFPLLKGLGHEECWIIFLNRANYVIGKERMSVGGSTATVIDIKKIVRRALDNKAESVILVHNHPSGNANPGSCDIKETKQLKAALCQMEISLLDHVVVCDDSYFSFSDNKISFVGK